MQEVGGPGEVQREEREETHTIRIDINVDQLPALIMHGHEQCGCFITTSLRWASYVLFCWAGPDEDGTPLRRRDCCSCRGLETGFTHLSCLVVNAMSQNTKWDAIDWDEFRKPWRVCSICFQSYQNQLAIDISTDFVLFVQGCGQYPNNQLNHLECRST